MVAHYRKVLGRIANTPNEPLEKTQTPLAISLTGFKQCVETAYPNPKTRYNVCGYGSKYAHILEMGNASELASLSYTKRQAVIKALSALAKYSGKNKNWVEIRQIHGLMWTDAQAESLAAFEKITSATDNPDTMINWVKGAKRILAPRYFDVIPFGLHAVLRPR